MKREYNKKIRTVSKGRKTRTFKEFQKLFQSLINISFWQK